MERRASGHSMAAWTIFTCTAGLFLTGAGCPVEPPPATIEPTTEAEPNDDLSSMQMLPPGDSYRITGNIEIKEDIDLFALGTLHAGDRIEAELTTPDSDLEAAVVLIEPDPSLDTARLIAVGDDSLTLDNPENSRFDYVLRRDIEQVVLGVNARFTGSVSTGTYELTVRITRGGEVPAIRQQVFMLDFDGGFVEGIDGRPIGVAAFDAASIHPDYAGQDDFIRSIIEYIFRENFIGFDVVVTTSDNPPPPGEPVSVIHIGVANAGDAVFASEGLAATLSGIDAFNSRLDDNALVLPDRFGGLAIALGELLDPVLMGIAIGNVASHEAGHLLGLHHAFDPADIMNTLDSPDTLLLDQRFQISLPYFTVFDSLGTVLSQNGRLLLDYAVGSTEPLPDLVIPVGDTPIAIASADLDGDGRADVVAANRFSNSLSLLHNAGNGQFDVSTLPLNAGPIAVAAVDLNGDALPELITANPGQMTVTVQTNNGGMSFAAGQTLTVEAAPRGLTAADLDGDGDQDLAVVYYTTSILELFFNEGGTFSSGATMMTGTSPQSVVAADLNNDGQLDLATTNFVGKSVSVFLNIGGGGFANPMDFPAGSLPYGLAAADFDGDGDLDLAIANSQNATFSILFSTEVSVLYNNGDGSFSSAFSFYTAGQATGIVAEDLDGDGDQDLAVACSGYIFGSQDLGALTILLNFGGGSFAQDVRLRAGPRPISVTADDFDGDGQPDLATSTSEVGTVQFFYSSGSL